MELRHLRSFLAVAEEGHFTRAADELHLSQPALSQQIRQLEDDLGSPLFDRIGRGVRLTAAGELFRSHARRIMEQVGEAQKSIVELDALARGTVRAAAVQTVNAYLMPALVSRFLTAHPKIAVRVDEHSADEVERAVLDGRANIGFTFVPARHEGLEVTPLFEEELVLVVSPKHRLARRKRIGMAQLAEEPLVLLPETFCTRRLIDHSLQAAGTRVRVAVEMNSIDGILRTVHSTGGATILPELAAIGSQNAGLCVVRLTQPTPRRTVGVASIAGIHLPPATARFAAMAAEQPWPDRRRR